MLVYMMDCNVAATVSRGTHESLPLGNPCLSGINFQTVKRTKCCRSTESIEECSILFFLITVDLDAIAFAQTRFQIRDTLLGGHIRT